MDPQPNPVPQTPRRCREYGGDPQCPVPPLCSSQNASIPHVQNLEGPGQDGNAALMCSPSKGNLQAGAQLWVTQTAAPTALSRLLLGLLLDSAVTGYACCPCVTNTPMGTLRVSVQCPDKRQSVRMSPRVSTPVRLSPERVYLRGCR